MSEPSPGYDGDPVPALPGGQPEPPRRTVRPPVRIPADAAAALVFGRPAGLEDGFAPPAFAPPSSAPPSSASTGSATAAAPPPAALAAAFGRPSPEGDALQRPPGTAARDDVPDPFWDATAADDPWRRPDAAVTWGRPGVDGDPGAPAPLGAGPRLSLREVLLGGRVRPLALLALAGVALLVGAVGGVVGRLTAEDASRLTTPDPTITQVVGTRERPPGSVAAIAARIVPSVVSIEIRVGDQGGTGSGVVIDPAGYVLTNNHVIAPAATTSGSTLEAVFHDGTRGALRIVGRDPKTDLAVLKVDVADPVVATTGSSAGLAVGDGVIAVGSPLGLAGTVTAGIVSALRRPVRLDAIGNDPAAVIDAIQTDAAINPGNSGGPLVDATGAVVGITTAIRGLGQTSDEGGSIGLGFAIPIDTARVIATELIRTGVVRHAEIGLNARSVSDTATDGAQVQNVQAGGAGAAAGIIEGDVVMKIGGRTVRGADELLVAVREHHPGDVVPVELVRDGRPLTVQVTLSSD